MESRTLSSGTWKGWEIKYMSPLNFFKAFKELRENTNLTQSNIDDYEFMLGLVKENKRGVFRDLRKERNKQYLKAVKDEKRDGSVSLSVPPLVTIHNMQEGGSCV